MAAVDFFSPCSKFDKGSKSLAAKRKKKSKLGMRVAPGVELTKESINEYVSH